MENDFFETLVHSCHKDLEWQNEHTPSETKYPRTSGFVRIDKLCLLTPEDVDIVAEMKVDLDEANNQPAAARKQLDPEIWSVSEIYKRIIELYFIQKMRPSTISKLTKQSKNRIYATVGNIKQTIMKFIKKRECGALNKRRFTEEVKEVISNYWKQRENKYYTIDDVRRYVDVYFEQNEVVSYSTVRRFMIKNLEMGYKRVSTRPPVVLTNGVVDKQKSFWKFYRMCRQWNIKIIQVDEFTVRRGTFVSMAWSKRGESGYAIQQQIVSRFSVIPAIWDSNLELVAISKSNTNGGVFAEFMKLLNEEMEKRYSELKERIVITLDGARYHWVKDVKEYWRKMNLMVVQTPPYIPQFSPVELFINWVKSKIRKKIRMNKLVLPFINRIYTVWAQANNRFGQRNPGPAVQEIYRYAEKVMNQFELDHWQKF